MRFSSLFNFAFLIVLDLSEGQPSSISDTATLAYEAELSVVQRAIHRTIPDKITPGKLRYVENSGICETTPGVYQASGYADIAPAQSMWFWFFAARHNPDTAPLALWLNGGPGQSSMVGLFRENGPCRINPDLHSVSRNPYSWNEHANMLYIDQPIGTGYSYGERVVKTSQAAAAAVWEMLQIFFSDPQFSELANREFAIWTESYGGRWGPTFAAYFLSQNAAITAGTLTGVKLNLKVLGISSGLIDAYTQYPSDAIYAWSNPYNKLVEGADFTAANNSLYEPGGCLELLRECNRKEADEVCSHAQHFCINNVIVPLSGPYDYFDVRARHPSQYPYNLNELLSDSELRSTIGAIDQWKNDDDDVYRNFNSTGDWTKSSLPDLESVINTGVRVHIVSGDADYYCNYVGMELVMDSMKTRFTSRYKNQPWTTWTIAGIEAGRYKNAGKLSYVRVTGAGHEVSAYGHGELEAGRAALVYFTQVMGDNPISSM